MGPDGFGWSIQCLAVFFYADEGLLPSSRPTCLQEVLDFLTGLFDRVSIHTNVRKTVGMVCHTCYMPSGHLEVAYTRMMVGWGHHLGDGNGKG